VVCHGWHTGFVLPASEVQKHIPELTQRFGHPAYYELGWGNADFYQAKRITVGLATKAICWPGDTVIHAVAINSNITEFFPNSEIITIPATPDELDELAEFVSRSFAKDTTGHIISIGPGIYGDSNFYQAVGKYHIANTCNKWTAKGLKSSGQDVSVTFKLNATSVMRYLKHKGYQQAPR
jgi:uncharacterized protein (TIGR02117 family)